MQCKLNCSNDKTPVDKYRPHSLLTRNIPIQNVLSLGKLVQNTFIPTALIIVWGWETCVYMYIIKGYMVVIGLCLVLSDKRMKMTGYSHRG